MAFCRASTLCTLALLGFAISQADAQNYPNRPVRIIVPFSPGGTVDGLARVVGNKLSEQLHQPFLPDFRPGGGGTIGADAVAKAPPDGYTILHNTVGQAIAPAIFRTLPFDTLNDFIPVTQLVASNLVLVATPSLPVHSIKELIALAKEKPGTLNYGMTGIGNPLQLAVEMFKHDTRTDIQAVPYRGDANIMAALISGEVQLAVVSVAIAKPLVDDGRIRPLGVTGTKRVATMPDVPTIGETVSGYAAISWHGFFAPANTPKEIVDTLQRETAKALATPDVMDRLRDWSNDPVGSRPEEFQAYFRAEVAKYIKVAKDAAIQQK
jgi:tripartite-type tricarboxylate transporter receptor subunit TctC